MQLYDFINSFLVSKEDKEHPLLGPNIKGMKMIGMLNSKRANMRFIATIINISIVLFGASLFIQLAVVDQSFDNFLFNLSVAAVSIVSITKNNSYVFQQKRWLELFENVSKEEIKMLPLLNEKMLEHKNFYTMYGRGFTFLYSCLVVLTGFAMVLPTPVVFLMDSEVRNGNKPYPEMISSWMPFDDQTVGGYTGAILIRAGMVLRGAVVISMFDTTCVATMSFLKGYTKILIEKCKILFGEGKEFISEEEVWKRIADCHRHHNFIIQQYSLLNSLLSPVMFLYVLVCSMSICCSVVQLSMEEVSTSQKIYVAEYTIALVFQLFVYCWHGNEISIEHDKVDRAIFESEWWKANCRTRKQLILLDGKFSKDLIINAGPFNSLSINTFVNVMKGAYSFLTLITQMQDT